MPHQNYQVGRSIAYGAAGGIVAGLVMAPFLMLTAIMTGMPANTMVVAMGLGFGASQDNAMMVGFGMHLVTSVLVGMIFGVVISIRGLRIASFGKGIGEGLIAGMVAFAVLFVPIGMYVMPPVLVEMMMTMDPSLTQQQAGNALQQGMPLMIGMGVLEHLVYGAVLGAVASAFVLKSRGISVGKELHGRKKYECDACHRKFDSMEEREIHIRSEHHGEAA